LRDLQKKKEKKCGGKEFEMKIVLDTSSWIDYFKGNDAGNKVKEYIENTNDEIITNILSLSELFSFFKRKGFNPEKAYSILISLSKIYNLDINFVKEAGLLHAEIKKDIKDFGMIDSFILLTAKKTNAKLITADNHFKNFKETILIK
jgi:predicted nucleic acid-binding protein